jgi:hypothetical protein
MAPPCGQLALQQRSQLYAGIEYIELHSTKVIRFRGSNRPAKTDVLPSVTAYDRRLRTTLTTTDPHTMQK